MIKQYTVQEANDLINKKMANLRTEIAQKYYDQKIKIFKSNHDKDARDVNLFSEVSKLVNFSELFTRMK